MRMNTLKRSTVRLIVIPTLSCGLVLIGTGAPAFANRTSASPGGIQPDIVVCPTSGSAFDITSQSSTQYGVSTLYATDNYSSTIENTSYTYDHSYTFSGSISGGGSVGVDLIVATIGAKAGFTVGLSVTATVDQKINLSIPAHDWGLIQDGVNEVTTYGTAGQYEGGGATTIAGCPLANSSSVVAVTAQSGVQIKLVDQTSPSETPPWPELNS
jgi:hypothetical protein